jgi:hypothetical protein
MQKKYLWLVILNLVFGLFYFIYVDSSATHYCGQTESKPGLALGLSPSWFNGKFQIRRDYKEIISSTDSDEPFFDEWVKGSELFKTITAYDVRGGDSGLLFKALNWDGVEQIFILREYSPSVEEKYVYEVSVQENLITDLEWVNVDLFSCRVGIYEYLVYFFLVLVVLINIIVILKALWLTRLP